jgi:hypothetical protein
MVTYTDRSIACVDCGVEFIHSAADQEFYAEKGFASEPKRCPSCRASRRQARSYGSDMTVYGGPRGYERADGDLHPLRQPGPGAVQAADGQARVLLGLLPRGQARRR